MSIHAKPHITPTITIILAASMRIYMFTPVFRMTVAAITMPCTCSRALRLSRNRLRSAAADRLHGWRANTQPLAQQRLRRRLDVRLGSQADIRDESEWVCLRALSGLRATELPSFARQHRRRCIAALSVGSNGLQGPARREPTLRLMRLSAQHL
jgi:hypothetical protein